MYIDILKIKRYIKNVYAIYVEIYTINKLVTNDVRVR